MEKQGQLAPMERRETLVLRVLRGLMGSTELRETLVLRVLLVLLALMEKQGQLAHPTIKLKWIVYWLACPSSRNI